MTKLPERFAVGMGGFLETPFYLARNRITPENNLQTQIFPWIEGVFDSANGTFVDMAWRQECMDMMNEVDENEVKDIEFLSDPPKPHPLLRA
ncbi:hypothetical protein BGX28_001592, partial [Mortierella sp. GBA30]